eukprot:9003137-Ditylum_brightwellii.AAC.1
MKSMLLTSPTKTTKQKKLQRNTNAAASHAKPWCLDFQHPLFLYEYIKSDETVVVVDLLVLPVTK